MKNIIAYSAEKLYRDFEKADEFFLSSGMKDMELYEKQLAEATRKAAAEHMAALYTDMNVNAPYPVPFLSFEKLR